MKELRYLGEVIPSLIKNVALANERREDAEAMLNSVIESSMRNVETDQVKLLKQQLQEEQAVSVVRNCSQSFSFILVAFSCTLNLMEALSSFRFESRATEVFVFSFFLSL